MQRFEDAVRVWENAKPSRVSPERWAAIESCTVRRAALVALVEAGQQCREHVGSPLMGHAVCNCVLRYEAARAKCEEE